MRNQPLRYVIAVLVILAGLTTLSWWPRCRPPGQPPPATRVWRPNIVLLSIDTLRADHLSTYGYFRATSPNLDRIAAEGVLFENAFTVMSHTLPAHVSLMTGVHTATHNVLSNGWRYLGPYPTLAERLADAGYATAGFVSGFPLTGESGMARGFQVYEDTGRVGDQYVLKIPGEVVNRRAATWLERPGGAPVFLFVHYFDTHDPYLNPPGRDPPFEVDDALRAYMAAAHSPDVPIETISPIEIHSAGVAIGDLATAINAYDNLVCHVDALVGELFDLIRELAQPDGTLLIITSDHGEGLGQHQYYSHGLHLYEEQIRIPLIVRCLGSNWPPRRIERAVSLLDVVPTVLELLSLPSAVQLHGHSLATLLQGSRASPPERWLLMQRRTFSDRAVRERGRFAARLPLFALRGNGSLKYLFSGDGREELYDLLADPLELHNLAESRPRECARLRRSLQDVRERYEAETAEAEQQMDEATRRALRSLGYVP